METKTNHGSVIDVETKTTLKKEIYLAIRDSFNEAIEKPNGNSVIGNLRNKLCKVINEREELKSKLKQIKNIID